MARAKVGYSELRQIYGDRLPEHELLAGGPEWLTGGLCSTKEGAGKLKAWVYRGGPGVEPTEFMTALYFVGDPALCYVTINVIKKLPPRCNAT